MKIYSLLKSEKSVLTDQYHSFLKGSYRLEKPIKVWTWNILGKRITDPKKYFCLFRFLKIHITVQIK